MKSKILVVTDIHGYKENVEDMIEIISPDFVLDCGDHDDDFYADKSVPWYFIHGNHENKKELEEMMYGKNRYKNLHLIKPGEMVSINGVNIAGFGGNYSEKTYFNKGKRKGNSFTHIKKSDVKAIASMEPNKKKLIDILLMHESSEELWDDSPYNFGQEINSKIISEFPNVKYVISGHYHVPMERVFENENETIRYEISLNTPEEYNYILFENTIGRNKNMIKRNKGIIKGRNKGILIREIQNKKSFKYY